MHPIKINLKSAICSHARCSLIIFSLVTASYTCIANTDIERERDLHDQLWSDVVQKFDAKTRTQANSRESILTEVEIYSGRKNIKGKTPITIASVLAPQVRKFSYLEIQGEQLDGIKSIAYKVAGGDIYTNPQQQTYLRIQIPGNLYADWIAQNQTIILEGEAVITGIRLVSLEGINSTFDASSFSLAEGSQPPLYASIIVDPKKIISFDGVSTLPKERFFRLYFSPGRDRSNMEDYFAKKGFFAGRQMVKLAYELETRHGAYTEPKLREDRERPGFADLSIFDLRVFDHYEDVDPTLEFAQCFNIWPSFMAANISGEKNVLGTPKVTAFEAAAELAAAYINDEIQDSGRSANYWEVKNESDITHEWTYHASSDYSSWSLLGDFHNKVSQAIKKVDPAIKVGGPASAWPRMEMGRPAFKVWKNHKKFMQVTRNNLDFYSHHFYDKGVTSSFDARTKSEDGSYEDWLQGRLDCVLDLLQAHMRNTDNIKPLLVTEYGTLAGGTREIDYWLRVCNYSSFMIQFMQRPADFAMTVPFLLGYMHWEPESGFALVRQNEEGDFELTKNAYFLDLWEGVGGQYLQTNQIHPKAHQLAWKQGNTIYIAVNNQTGGILHLKPELLLSDENEIVSIQYRHPTYRNGSFQLARGSLEPKEPLTLPNSETAVIEIQTLNPEKTSEKVVRNSYYGDQTVLQLSSNPKLQINIANINKKQLKYATLRLGLQDFNGPEGTLHGTLNRYNFKIDLNEYKNIENFFEYVDVDVPIQYLQNDNLLSLKLPHSQTIVSHAVIRLMELGPLK